MFRYLTVALVAFSVSCKTTQPDSTSATLSGGGDNMESANHYICKGDGSGIGMTDQIELTVGEKTVRLAESGKELNFGKIDTKYKPRKNPRAIRYKQFDWGDDCELQLVMDNSVLAGANKPKATFVCRGDSFASVTYKCANQGPASIAVPGKKPAKPTPQWAATYQCNGKELMDGSSTLRVSAGQVELEGAEFPGEPYLGKVDKTYKPKTPDRMRYIMDTGWDCGVSLILPKAALSGVKTLKPSLQCVAEGFVSETLDCTNMGGGSGAAAVEPAQSIKEIFEGIVENAEVANGDAGVMAYDASKFDAKKIVAALKKSRPDHEGGGDCEFEDETGFDNVMGRITGNNNNYLAPEHAETLRQLNDAGIIKGIFYRGMSGGESEACSIFEVEIYSQGGEKLYFTFDFTT